MAHGIEMLSESGIVCKVCNLGQIISRVTKTKTIRPSLLEKWRGKKPYSFATKTVTYCNVCGVKYEFTPAKELKPPIVYEDSVQIQPNQWQGKDSLIEKAAARVKTFMKRENLKAEDISNPVIFEKLLREANNDSEN